VNWGKRPEIISNMKTLYLTSLSQRYLKYVLICCHGTFLYNRKCSMGEYNEDENVLKNLELSVKCAVK
jgi:hypothetical protein